MITNLEIWKNLEFKAILALRRLSHFAWILTSQSNVSKQHLFNIATRLRSTRNVPMRRDGGRRRRECARCQGRHLDTGTVTVYAWPQTWCWVRSETLFFLLSHHHNIYAGEPIAINRAQIQTPWLLLRNSWWKTTLSDPRFEPRPSCSAAALATTRPTRS